MKLYSIMPLTPDYADEMCDDIEYQYKSGVATEALFCMTLTPEGNPVIDKAQILCDEYRIFRDKLNARGLKSGVLVQATIGHGYQLTTKIPFTPVYGMLDCGEKYTACPYDENFRSYIREAMVKITKEKPSTIMVDDDFRLFARSYRGCTCPLHMKEINRRAGTNLTREELCDILDSDTDEARRLVKIFYDTQIDSLIGAAKAMREGIDSVDPKMQGAFCICGSTCEGASEIAKILAGEGNPVIVRVNNGKYCSAGARGIMREVARAATQIDVMKNGVDIFLAETDTCPQNRYSTSASSLHTHFTATILEGAGGCKHWITRMSDYEPNSGIAYRKKLAENTGFYNTLSALVPTLRWEGCRIPLPGKAWEPTVPVSKYRYADAENAWALCVLERLGLPTYYSDIEGGAVMLDGRRDELFEDERIKKMLGGTVFLAAESAKSLIKRGFGEYLGVDVKARTPDEAKASGEIIHATGKNSSSQQKLHTIIPTSESTKAHSTVYTRPDGKTRVPLFPGVTSFDNSLGGKAVVFSGTPEANYNYQEAFSFLNESRKAQMIELLRESGNLPIYYPDDAEVYLKAAKTADGKQFVAFFNIGLDNLDEVTLVSEKAVSSVKMLTAGGEFVEVAFDVQDGKITVHTPAYILNPVILILE